MITKGPLCHLISAAKISHYISLFSFFDYLLSLINFFRFSFKENERLFLFSQDGKALLSFKQESPGDHVDPNEVLKALGIEGSVTVDPHDVECGAEACALPKKK